MTLLDRIAPPAPFGNSYAESDGSKWSAELLYEEVEKQKCVAEKFPLKFVDTTNSPFRGDRLCDFVYNTRRIQNADYSIPIVVGPLGGILDGFHRIAHALLDGKSFVMCYRLKEMPEPDGKE